MAQPSASWRYGGFSLSARSYPRLPQAPTRLGQAARSAALAGHTMLIPALLPVYIVCRRDHEGFTQRQSMPQAAPSPGLPRPISRYFSAGLTWPATIGQPPLVCLLFGIGATRRASRGACRGTARASRRVGAPRSTSGCWRSRRSRAEVGSAALARDSYS